MKTASMTAEQTADWSYKSTYVRTGTIRLLVVGRVNEPVTRLREGTILLVRYQRLLMPNNLTTAAAVLVCPSADTRVMAITARTYAVEKRRI